MYLPTTGLIIKRYSIYLSLSHQPRVIHGTELRDVYIELGGLTNMRCFYVLDEICQIRECDAALVELTNVE